jgi:hypothetical protein
MVAVETWERVLIASEVRDIENSTPVMEIVGLAHLAGRAHRVKGTSAMMA